MTADLPNSYRTRKAMAFVRAVLVALLGARSPDIVVTKNYVPIAGKLIARDATGMQNYPRVPTAYAPVSNVIQK